MLQLNVFQTFFKHSNQGICCWPTGACADSLQEEQCKTLAARPPANVSVPTILTSASTCSEPDTALARAAHLHAEPVPALVPDDLLYLPVQTLTRGWTQRLNAMRSPSTPAPSTRRHPLAAMTTMTGPAPSAWCGHAAAASSALCEGKKGAQTTSYLTCFTCREVHATACGTVLYGLGWTGWVPAGMLLLACLLQPCPSRLPLLRQLKQCSIVQAMQGLHGIRQLFASIQQACLLAC